MTSLQSGEQEEEEEEQEEQEEQNEEQEEERECDYEPAIISITFQTQSQ